MNIMYKLQFVVTFPPMNYPGRREMIRQMIRGLMDIGIKLHDNVKISRVLEHEGLAISIELYRHKHSHKG